VGKKQRVLKSLQYHNAYMGRIKTKMIKSVTQDVFKHYEDQLTTDFEQNKQVIEEKVNGGSKKLRNVIAGYATRLKKKKR